VEEIELQTHALKLSHEILEHLSVGVIGIDPDGVIALANQRARVLFENEGKLLLGSQVNTTFDTDIGELIHKTTDTAAPQETRYINEGNNEFMARCVPLHAESKSRGIVLTFIEVK
jgi:nitrogen fixation/metabolism regulation signal transduction histidine kinase